MKPAPKQDEQAELWNGTAGSAWVEAQEALDGMYAPFELLLVEAVRATAARRVLDVGCGTGATTLAAARVAKTAIGIDISAPMLAVARARGAQESSRAQFICADAATHAFEPASFELLVSRFGVMFFADPVAAFANLHRVMTDGGRLQVIVWRGPDDNPFMTAAERAAAPLLPGIPARDLDGPGQFAFADTNKVRRILDHSGWRQIDIQPLDVVCAFPAAELERYVTRLGPLGRVLQSADEPARRRAIAAVLTAFDPFMHGAEVRFNAACWNVKAVSGGN